MGLVAVAAHPLLHVVGGRHRQEMKLDVGPADARARADEAAGFEMVGRAEPGFEGDPAHADQGLGQQAGRRIERDRLRAGLLDIEFQMVLEVRADAGQVVDDRDAAVRADGPAAPMPESIRSCGALIGPPLRTISRRAPAVRTWPPGPPCRYSTPRARRPSRSRRVAIASVAIGQVGAPRRRLEVGVRRAPAPAPVDRHVHRAEAFLAVAIHIGGASVAGLFARFDEGAVERVGPGPARGVQGARKRRGSRRRRRRSSRPCGNRAAPRP